MRPLLLELRRNRLLWLLVFVPVVLIVVRTNPNAHTLHFVLSLLALLPLSGLLSQATESIAAKTGDSVGGLLNSTMGNLPELVIAIAALKGGQYTLVKATIVGAVVTNASFMLGSAFLLGGLRHHIQEFNRIAARFQAGLLFLATVALLIPSAVTMRMSGAVPGFVQKLSVVLSILLLIVYGFGLFFSLKTHRELFAGKNEETEPAWSIGLALTVLAVDMILMALVSEVFADSVQEAALAFGMTPAFVGFIVVALVGAAPQVPSAVSAARRDHLDLTISISLGSASQIALFVAPVLILLSYFVGPAPIDLNFWSGAVVMMFLATLTCALVTNSGRSAWFVGVLVLVVYLMFATALYLMPPTES